MLMTAGAKYPGRGVAVAGGGFFTGGVGSPTPIWHPPVSLGWIVSLALVVVAANVEVLPPSFTHMLTHPAGFFVTFLLALGAYEAGFPPATFAILFLLLMIWSFRKRQEEGFSSQVDWATNNKRWFVESVLKENPMGIKEKDVKTYPVQGDTPSR